MKQVIVIRKKFPSSKGGTKSMPHGKAMAQGFHATMGFVWNNKGKATKKVVQEWLSSGQTKIVLKTDTEEDLQKLYNQAEKAGLEVHMITDAGRTEFNGVPTNTCIAIGPGDSKEIDKITGHLKHY